MHTCFPKRFSGCSAMIGVFLLTAWAVGTAAAEGTAEKQSAASIEVSGEGVASAQPDVAVVRLGVETRSPEVSRALAEASDRVSSVNGALTKNGVAAEDIATVTYNVQFVQPPQGGTGPAGNTGRNGRPSGYYRVIDISSVTIRDLSSLGAVLDDALSAGANEIQGVRFEISDTAALEKRARERAYAQAHQRAVQLAALSGVRLGRVIRIRTGGSATPVQAGAFRAAAVAAPGVSPGMLEVHVTLNVVYAIAR